MASFVVLVPLAWVFAGCSAPVTGADVPEPQRHVAEVHRSRCGSCHVPVEPGTRTKQALETAFTRHRSRVHLTEAEWQSMIDYLAQPSSG